MDGEERSDAMDAVTRGEIPIFDLASFGEDYARLGAALGQAARGRRGLSQSTPRRDLFVSRKTVAAFL